MQFYGKFQFFIKPIASRSGIGTRFEDTTFLPLPSTVTTADPPTSTTSETPAPTESSSEDHGDPILAGSIDRQCLTGEEYDGVAQGWNITLAGVPTYYNKPSLAWRQANPGPAKVLLFYSDVYSPFFMNNILLMDWYASQGYWVFGLDYFLGDSAQNQVQLYDVEAWVAFAKARADPLVPAWNAAVRSLFPPGTKYVSVGYCFGAPFSMEAAATNEVVAAAFGQPALLTESHFYNVTLWAKQESANSILGWFDRFTA
ncbi:hypothetical protein CC1G_12149 [Coprinopsis cinerea okayama7|uniref:Dienelactone hydrolase domain-containing protein n=1 Tax=Coprinopsis cinerea (strain Okayama-7 / 130 / ATCC MYA-4618 / FGSC 9003) TaxID=240176 RepID=A8P6Z6_COPC7|nr:hypothetical protein CC1G_12149 [Coprinopsis cinerea okayama7\|eukprot:XP_001839258.1 hypothetical protein CC1G_12149 [Coprinopsis cinerea okayama7\